MIIEKLAEFAKNGDKNLDNLDVNQGFLQSEKPERQWFNKLFNSITTKTNEIIGIQNAIQDTKDIASSGFVIIDSFELGATITQRNQALRHAADGKLYRWAGDLPKVVPSSSTPANSGGIATSAWLEISDQTLRSDIINNGLVTDNLVKASPVVATGVIRNQFDINKDDISVKSFGAKGDLVTNDSAAFQKNAVYMDESLIASMYIPAQEEGYSLNETVGFKIPTMVHGNRGATYNRGAGKGGSVVIGTTDLAFDFGLTATTEQRGGNAADQWTIKNVAFINASGTTLGTKTAVSHTANTNGPDRGFLMREVSASGLKSALHIKNNEVQTQLATLVVENCVLSNNLLPIHAEGMVFGSRIVGNQIEQCSGGAIHGALHAGTAIHDNMLEGNANTIYIKDHLQDRNGCDLSLERNYFEANTGDYLVKMDSFSNNSIYSRGNYVSSFMTADGFTPDSTGNKPTDHFLLTNIYRSIHVYDRLAVSFYGFAELSADNNLQRYFVYASPDSLFSTSSSYIDTASLSLNNQQLITMGREVSTSIGDLYFIDKFGVYISTNVIAQPNAVIEINASYFAETTEGVGSITIKEAGGVVLFDGSVLASNSARSGSITTVKVICTIPATATNKPIQVLFNSIADGNNTYMYVVGLAINKLGSYVADAGVGNRFLTSKANPELRRKSDGYKVTLEIPATSIAASGSNATTITAYGIVAGDKIIAKYQFANSDAAVTKTVVAAEEVILLTLVNNGASPFVVTEGDTISIVVKR